ncbi:hypothetical protein RMSM_07568 [Rhodopirellula maiorica SM1]|uniref:Uncharacterized protein n=1 Tax=Rhodopirellula maiorica SM1 TaxID=1265738 RepID=M5RNE7_9BACT|nr:hypothetical protein RMSM_07568 [Rhodopirellula maiorica SM1]
MKLVMSAAASPLLRDDHIVRNHAHRTPRPRHCYRRVYHSCNNGEIAPRKPLKRYSPL